MTIRVVGGTDFKANASRILECCGNRIEVVAELCDCHCDKGYVTLRVVDPPRRTRPGGQWPDPEFATREPPFARSLAPDWGLSCPYCGARNHDYHTACTACQGTYRVPAGTLTAAEARRRPTEVAP